MELKDRGLLRKVLENTKWFIFPAILVLYASTAILMLVGIIRLYYIVYDFVSVYKSYDSMNFSLISAHFITIVDIYLLALVCYIFAVGIYKLFIGNFDSFTWLKINTIDDLKLQISKMVILFLATLIVQKIAHWEDPQSVLYFGIIIGITCAILVWYSMLLQKKTKE